MFLDIRWEGLRTILSANRRHPQWFIASHAIASSTDKVKMKNSRLETGV
ncbi:MULTISPECIES: hypothetical protein [Bacillus]|nr:hypothetical protein BSM4216_3764 [Bacillus smithii]